MTKYVRTPDGRIMTYKTRTYVFYQDTEVPDDEVPDLLNAAQRARIELIVRSTPTSPPPPDGGTGNSGPVSVDDVVGLPQLIEDLRAATSTQVQQEVTARVDALDLSMSFGDLTNVQMSEPVTDPQGNLTGGPDDGAAVLYDRTLNKIVVRPIDPTTLPADPRYVETEKLPAGFPAFFVPQQVIDTAGELEDPDLPVGGMVHDYTRPPELLNEGVQVVTATGSSVTLTAEVNGYPTTMHDLTLTAATVAVTFPSAAAGARRSVLYRQDGTGGRTISTTGVVNRASGAITLQTAAGAADLVEYLSIGGNAWRVYNHVAYAAQTVAATAPTVRGTFGGTTGTSNVANSVTTSALPSGITATDLGRLLVVRDGTDIAGGNTTDGPQPAITGWTQVDKLSGNSMTTFVFERAMAAADSGTTLTVTIGGSTDTDARLTVVGAVIAGGTATDQQRIPTLDSTADLELTTPTFTPTAANSLVLVFAGIRFGSSTAPTVAPPAPSDPPAATDWTEQREVTEGRSAAAQFTAYLASKTLSGQAGLQQPSAAFVLSGANAHDQSFLYVIKPA